MTHPNPYTIGCYENAQLTGYVCDRLGKVWTFTTLADAQAQARQFNEMQPAGRVYAPVASESVEV